MKSFLDKISIIFLGLMLFSCSEDLLDIPQKSVLSSDDYYANAGPEEAEELIAAVYHKYYRNVEGVNTSLFLDVLSDDHFSGGRYGDNALGLGDANDLIITPEAEALGIMYENVYQVIYWCNSIIEKIPDSEDETIKRVKAEANFFRALCMFEAVRWWGTPPFVTHVLSQDEYYPENGDPAEIIPWVLERMQEAADVLPALSGMGQQQAFGARISKHAALAHKGKVALWYGQKYNDAEILAQAVTPLQTVINSNLYGLLDDMSLLGRPAADFSKEYVFEHNSADNNGYPGAQAENLHIWLTWNPEFMYVPDNIRGFGWGWATPTGNFGEFLASHDGGIEKPRFMSTIRTFDQILDLNYSGPKGMVEGKGGVHHAQGYFRFRHLLYENDIFTDLNAFFPLTKSNAYFMRYPEVLLLYAEAKFLVDGDVDGTGLAALNEVRSRAQVPELTNLTYQDIKDERRAELYGERERYFDLVRWGDAATLLADKGKVWYGLKGYVEGTTDWDIETRPGNGNGWDDKYNLLPFPRAQLSANPNLTQNTGW